LPSTGRIAAQQSLDADPTAPKNQYIDAPEPNAEDSKGECSIRLNERRKHKNSKGDDETDLPFRLTSVESKSMAAPPNKPPNKPSGSSSKAPSKAPASAASAPQSTKTPQQK
jgi:hypothetical protein